MSVFIKCLFIPSYHYCAFESSCCGTV